MSIIKSIKQVLGLGPAAENHFFDGSVPNQLSLKRGTPDAPGTELMKFLAGVVSFPNQGQSLTANGYVKLPGGLIIQWGGVTTSAGGGVTWTFPIPFPNACFGVNATPIINAPAPWQIGAVVQDVNSAAIYTMFNNAANSIGVRCIAVGF